MEYLSLSSHWSVIGWVVDYDVYVQDIVLIWWSKVCWVFIFSSIVYRKIMDFNILLTNDYLLVNYFKNLFIEKEKKIDFFTKFFYFHNKIVSKFFLNALLTNDF